MKEESTKEREKLKAYFEMIKIKPRYCKNIPEEWEKLRTNIEQEIWNNYKDDRADKDTKSVVNTRLIISTFITEDTTEPENNIFNLQYFFLCADSIHKINPHMEMALIVKCKAEDDVFRARVYLFIQAKFRKYVRVSLKRVTRGMTGNEKNMSCSEECDYYLFPELETKELEKSVGRILPLFSVSMGKTAEDVSYVDLAEVNTTWLSRKVEKESFSGERIISWGNSPKNVLENVMKSNLDSLKGMSNDEKYVDDDQMKLVRNNIKNIESKIADMSFLAQLIWLFELRYLYTQTELREYTEKFWGKTDMVWEYTKQNAVAYAEGILQLLENSCQHSCGGKGYFSFRVHNVDMDSSNAKILSMAERRERIYRRFRINIMDQPLDVEQKCYLEFSVIDDAYDISSNRTCGVAEKAKVTSLTELFWGERSQQNKDDIIHHYGLELFCINTVLNEGRFIFKSPADTKELGGFASFLGKDNKIKQTYAIDKDWKSGLYTHYKILIPLYPRKNRKRQSESEKNNERMDKNPLQSLFDDTILDKKPTEEIVYYIPGSVFFAKKKELNDLFSNCYKSQKDKMEYVKNIEATFEKKIGGNITENKVVAIGLEDYARIQIELFAKGLFSFFSQCPQIKYIMLEFDSDRSIAEFMRISSVFYNKFGKSSWMRGRQIALCGMNETMNCKVVKTVLAGEDIESVNQTARIYMYYNPEVSQKLIAQLKYLTRKPFSDDEGKCEPLYPFDLIKYSENGKSWFLQRMSKLLEMDLQAENMGCKLANAHVCLGSRIHIKDFYEAELLFHNIGNVYRFAYCIAEKIRTEVEYENIGDGPLILIGYENYSVLLVSEVVRILKRSGLSNVKEIEYMTFVRNKRGKESIVFSAELERMQEKQKLSGRRLLLSASFITILPIGSTMSTVYKLINVTTREMYKRFAKPNEEMKKLNFLGHYAVIVVSCKNNDEDHIQDKYWREEKNQNILVLCNERNIETAPETRVHFFLKAKTEWYLPYCCPMCGSYSKSNNIYSKLYPLGHVDKTSTIPKLIYPAYESNYKGSSFSISNSKSNLNKLQELCGCISYGHIIFLNNHFQFFVNFPEYYEKCRVNMSENLKKWFSEQCKKVEKYAFNIIVSPLSELEPNFLKEVIDNVFQYNVRFLYIPLNKEFKENVRSKFRYFAEEYKSVCEMNPQMPINVYYVDYSVVSAQTLYRGRNLINMLMTESGFDASKKINVYKKVFVLLTRSSFDTVNSFVENPDEDYCAYATLSIPSFNTWENSCPICEKVNLYNNLAKCSATNELYWHYKRLEEKHSVRTPEEYNNWHNSQILLDAAFYRKSLQWFLDAELINKNALDDKLSNDLLAVWLQKQYAVNEETGIYDLFKGDMNKPLILVQDTIGQKFSADDRMYVLNFVQKRIVDVKNYLRLLCTHKIMELQDTFYKKSGKGYYENKNQNIQTKIVEFLKNELLLNYEKASGVSIIIKREILISYLKVISRGYLSYLAPMRETIYRIMNELMELLLACWQNDQEEMFMNGGNSQLIDADFIELLNVQGDQDDYWQIYQLALTLLKRLCDLQSVKILEYSFFEKWRIFVKKLWDKYFDGFGKEVLYDQELNECRKSMLEIAMQDYTKCLKWSVAATEDGGKGILLKKLCEKIKIEDEKESAGNNG